VIRKILRHLHGLLKIPSGCNYPFFITKNHHHKKDAPAGFYAVQTDNPNDNVFYNNLNDHIFTVYPYNSTAYVTSIVLPYGNGNDATAARNVSSQLLTQVY
jgi:hypothetical protein